MVLTLTTNRCFLIVLDTMQNLHRQRSGGIKQYVAFSVLLQYCSTCCSEHLSLCSVLVQITFTFHSLNKLFQMLYMCGVIRLTSLW